LAKEYIQKLSKIKDSQKREIVLEEWREKRVKIAKKYRKNEHETSK
jgi:hypothetical protein